MIEMIPREFWPQIWSELNENKDEIENIIAETKLELLRQKQAIAAAQRAVFDDAIKKTRSEASKEWRKKTKFDEVKKKKRTEKSKERWKKIKLEKIKNKESQKTKKHE